MREAEGSLIKTPEDLRPGDIYLGPIGGVVGLGVGFGQLLLGEAFRSGTLSIRHVGIVVQRYTEGVGPYMVQAMPGGAEEILMGEGHWTERCAYVRLPEDYPGQSDDAAHIARMMVKEQVPYSFASYLSLAGWKWGVRPERLTKWINRRRPGFDMMMANGQWRDVALPCEAICSVLADQAWSLTGKTIIEGTRPQAVTPGMLADVLSYTDGAVWARPKGLHLPARSWQV